MAKLLYFIIFCILQFHSFSLKAYHLCPHHQSLSLLNFKDALQIDTNKEHCTKRFGLYSVDLSSYFNDNNNPIIESKISSWSSTTNCCKWKGFTCDEFTGNVVEVDISVSRVTRVIDSNSSLFQLSNLKRLNLAHNLLYTSKISPEFCKFTHLTHLNLTNSGFGGKIPSEISQLKGLVSLDLSHNGLFFEPYVFRILLQNMTRLRELSLSNVNISSSLPNNLSSSITIIDLSDTGPKGTFPFHIFHLPNLQQLSLVSNFHDDSVSLPSFIGSTSSFLQKLILFDTLFSGKLLDTITGRQLQTFPSDSHIGNDGLCGFPLSQSCGPSMTQSPQVDVPDEEDDQEHVHKALTCSQTTLTTHCWPHYFGHVQKALKCFDSLVI